MNSLINVSGTEIKVQGKLLRIARLEGDKYKFLDAPAQVIAELRDTPRRIDLFTFMQRLPAGPPRFSYPMESDNLATLGLTTFDHWWTKQVDAKTRNMVRKSEKSGLETREVPFDNLLVKGIWKIYNETPVRQGKPFPHYGKDLQTVYKEEATHLDCSVFIGTFFEGNLIGFIKFVVDESRGQAGIMNIVSLAAHRDKAPTNALIAQAVRSCTDRAVPFLTYSNFSYGKKQRDSLSDFKKNNGFQKIELPRYYVPLTTRGSIAFRLGIHHGLRSYVPENMAARFRELRDAWYSQKLRAMPQNS
jgi:hypothetical protein